MTTTASALDTFAVASPSALGTTPAAEASRRIAPVAAVRTLVLAFLILAGSLGATLLAPAEEAAATHANTCAATARVQSGTSGGYAIKRGIGSFVCYDAGANSSLYVQLFSNGVRVASAVLGSYNSTGTVATPWVYCGRGYTYQTKVSYMVNGVSTTAWSATSYC